jgi:methyl-accepting chemotaxis protein
VALRSGQRVAQIVEEISAGAREQADVIGNVNASVSSLDSMTQQNAALVEQAAAVAGSLRHQAEALVKSVSVFRLSPAAEDIPAEAVA